MDALFERLNTRVAPTALLGYLNFSDGRPDPKFQRALNEACEEMLTNGEAEPWQALRRWLFVQADQLAASGSAAFQDLSQCRAVIAESTGPVLRAYREFHRDLLAHQSDGVLFNSFFLARVCEAVLSQGSPWTERDRIVAGAVKKLNDYVGHRPIAILETRPNTELYPHERLRPVPVYLRGVGSAAGPYRELIESATTILRTAPQSIKDEAWFDFDLLDELAFDPRAYDHGHPVNRRPNYLFGEWDPHLIDTKGRYRRFVVRQTVLDALIERIRTIPPTHRRLNDPTSALRFEAAAVLAGTILMASGICGNGPTAISSESRLADIVPEVARFRDSFYAYLLKQISGEHAELLHAEAGKLKQPFGGIRQHLNQELARKRAEQLQNHELAIILSLMGYPEQGGQFAAGITTTSVRILSRTAAEQTAGEFDVARGRLKDALARMPVTEDLIRRGIECGSLADPWNILGYQGQYPLFQSREDSTLDPRVDELIEALGRQFDLYAEIAASAAATGREEELSKAVSGVEQLAEWWDKFAAFEVSDIPRLHGGERAEAAAHVAKSLAEWKRRDATAVPGRSPGGPGEDIAFWRDRREGFTSATAFAQVIDALLERRDWRASSALLIAWLSESDAVVLEDGAASFHESASRWMDGVGRTEDRHVLIPRFLALIEANADRMWNVPRPPATQAEPKTGKGEYSSAYDDVTFKDSADDGEDGAVAGGGFPRYEIDFTIAAESDELENRLAFFSSISELWRKVSTFGIGKPDANDPAVRILPEASDWLAVAVRWYRELIELIEGIHAIEIPEPVGGVDEVMEYDRRRMTKDHLIDMAIDTTVHVGRAIRALSIMSGKEHSLEGADWQSHAPALEYAVAADDAAHVRSALVPFMNALRSEPLLFIPLSEGGDPRPILDARSALSIFESLFERLPPMGLIRETYHLVRLAKLMERNGPDFGRRVSEFDRLFRIALISVVETLLEASKSWDREPRNTQDSFVDTLRKIADSFLSIWIQHSQTLRLSAIEAVMDDAEWKPFRDFIVTYGRELFTAHFLTYGNVRGLLHRGISAWLDDLVKRDAETRPEKLLADLDDGTILRSTAAQYLEITLHSIAEHYEEYRDYNTTTTWSDYGENLHVLLDFLRIKARYERYAWRMKPLVLAHEVLCRKGMPEMAERWERSLADFSRPLAAELLQSLADKEVEHAVRLRTVRHRIEEKFLKPLALDRLTAEVGPCVQEARRENRDSPRFLDWLKRLHVLAESPAGVGLDVPVWLRKLREEVDRVRRESHVPPAPIEPVLLTREELEAQLSIWDVSIVGGSAW